MQYSSFMFLFCLLLILSLLAPRSASAHTIVVVGVFMQFAVTHAFELVMGIIY